jgi:hypothetical protein
MCLGLSVAAAAYGQRNKDDDTSATKRACSVEECFFERDVRDFEVIDQTHVIVYTGSQRCAFHLELRGTFCDLTFAPELYFSKSSDPESFAGDPTRENPFGTPSSSRRSLRICENDISVQVQGGRFTESGDTRATDRFGNERTDCRISSVRSITDDELVELYVARGVVPPLPPMGTGEIEVGEQDDPPADREPRE